MKNFFRIFVCSYKEYLALMVLTVYGRLWRNFHPFFHVLAEVLGGPGGYSSLAEAHGAHEAHGTEPAGTEPTEPVPINCLQQASDWTGLCDSAPFENRGAQKM